MGREAGWPPARGRRRRAGGYSPEPGRESGLRGGDRPTYPSRRAARAVSSTATRDPAARGDIPLAPALPLAGTAPVRIARRPRGRHLRPPPPRSGAPDRRRESGRGDGYHTGPNDAPP